MADEAGGRVWKGARGNSLRSDVLDLDLEGLWEHLPNRRQLAQMWCPRPRLGMLKQRLLSPRAPGLPTQQSSLSHAETLSQETTAVPSSWLRDRLRPPTLHLSPVHRARGEI